MSEGTIFLIGFVVFGILFLALALIAIYHDPMEGIERGDYHSSEGNTKSIVSDGGRTE